MNENGFVMDNKAEYPKAEARHGVRVLKGLVRRPYRRFKDTGFHQSPQYRLRMQ